MSKIPLEPQYGLCNRLRFVFSKLEQSPNEVFEVVWRPDYHCPGKFQDVFEDIPRLKFIKAEVGSETDTGFNYTDGYIPTYRELKPTKNVSKQAKEVLKRLGDFSAIHVRQTDWPAQAKRMGVPVLPEIYYLAAAACRKGNIYLATDNLATVRQFQEWFGDRVMTAGEWAFNDTHKWRQTSLTQAVVDLFVASEANHFRGTPYSSFSDLIRRLRLLKLQQFKSLMT